MRTLQLQFRLFSGRPLRALRYEKADLTEQALAAIERLRRAI